MRSFKSCRLYEDFHHRTVKYFQLQEEIEVLIINKYLNEFVVGMWDAKKSIEKEKGKELWRGNAKEWKPCGSKKCTYVGIITGGLTLTSGSKRLIKTHRRIVNSKEVNMVNWSLPLIDMWHFPISLLFLSQTRFAGFYSKSKWHVAVSNRPSLITHHFQWNFI